MSIKRGRVITLPTQNAADFKRGLQKGDGTAKSEAIGRVNVKLFNGQTFENDGRGSNEANLTINFNTMSNYGGGSKYLGSAGPDDAALAGKSDDEIKGMLSPVYVDQFTDVSDPVNPDKVRVSIDPKALAAASYASKMENSQNNGTPAPRETTKDRLDLRFSFATTHNGVAGMSEKGFAANVAKAAQQKYILSASAKNPEAGVPVKGDIETVSKIYAAEYAKFAKTAVEKGCTGIKAMVGDGDNRKQGKDTIEGTSFEALSNLGLKVATVDGATVIGGSAEGKNASDVNKALVAFNRAFNAHMSQVINGDQTLSAGAKSLGNMMNMNAYAVMPPREGSNDRNMILVQPAASASIQPFSSAFTKAYDAATHGGINGVVKTPEELYGKAVIDKAQGITNGFDNSLDKDASKAKEIQTAQYDAVAAAVAGPEGPDGPDR